MFNANAQVTQQEVKREVTIEALKEKILAAIGWEIVYAFRKFDEEHNNEAIEKLDEALNIDPRVGKRISTLVDTLKILKGKIDEYPRW